MTLNKIWGKTWRNDFMVHIYGDRSSDDRICTIRANTPALCFRIANVVVASIEIDEITKPENKAHE